MMYAKIYYYVKITTFYASISLQNTAEQYKWLIFMATVSWNHTQIPLKRQIESHYGCQNMWGKFVFWNQAKGISFFFSPFSILRHLWHRLNKRLKTWLKWKMFISLKSECSGDSKFHSKRWSQYDRYCWDGHLTDIWDKRIAMMMQKKNKTDAIT